jgi:hypothetical protein
MTLGIALPAVALGGFIHGALGLGFPLVTTPLIALVTDVKTAIILTLAPTLAVNIISIIWGGGWRESLGRYWSVALFVLLGSILGTKLLIIADPRPFRLILAVIIVIYLYTSSLQQLSWRWISYHPGFWGAGFGFAAGFMAGTVNVAVPILIIYFSEMRLSSLALVQCLNLSFLSGKTAQIGTFALSGHLIQASILLSLGFALVASLALLVGTRLRRRIDADVYRQWLRRILFIVAAILVVQFWLDFGAI